MQTHSTCALDICLVLEEVSSLTHGETASWLSLYPINTLRNAALGGAKTTHVFLLDVDFLPSEGLERRMRNALALHPDATLSSVLVIPAFEEKGNRWSERRNRKLAWDSTAIPTIEELKEGKDVRPFHVDHFPQGHAPTDFGRW